MSLGQLSGRGKQNNKLYYYTVNLTSGTSVNGHFSFTANEYIDRFSVTDLSKLIYKLSKSTSTYGSIHVSGMLIDTSFTNSSKIAMIRSVTGKSTGTNISVGIAKYNDSTSSISTDSYNTSSLTIIIECYEL